MSVEFELLELKHKQILDNYFSINRTKVSEFNFTEMFIWRKIRNTKIGFINNNICILIEKDNKKILYRPFGKNKIKETIKLFFYNHLCDFVYGYLQEEIENLYLDDEYIIEKDRDNFDYVYLADDLINLKGRKYDGKRNHLKKFEKMSYNITEINKEILPEVFDFQKRWCADRLCDDDMSLRNESLAVNELLSNFDKLSVFGSALYVNNNIEGYTIATELNKETAVVIVEKANPEIKGIYQALNRIFAEKFLSKYKYINREQDAGSEGLRKAKLSYHPHHFVEKLIIKEKR